MVFVEGFHIVQMALVYSWFVLFVRMFGYKIAIKELFAKLAA